MTRQSGERRRTKRIETKISLCNQQREREENEKTLFKSRVCTDDSCRFVRVRERSERGGGQYENSSMKLQFKFYSIFCFILFIFLFLSLLETSMFLFSVALGQILLYTGNERERERESCIIKVSKNPSGFLSPCCPKLVLSPNSPEPHRLNQSREDALYCGGTFYGQDEIFMIKTKMNMHMHSYSAHIFWRQQLSLWGLSFRDRSLHLRPAFFLPLLLSPWASD